MARPSDPLRRVIPAGKVLSRFEDQMGMETVADLLWTLPNRYVERGRASDLSELVVGESVTIVAEVVEAKHIPARPGSKVDRLEVTVTDGKASLRLTFFRQGYRKKDLTPGTSAMFAGEVGTFNRQLQMVNPEVQLLEGGAEGAEAFAGGLIPIYPTTKGVKTWELPKAVRFALDTLEFGPQDETLPDEVRARHGLPSLETAWRLAHRPERRSDRDVAVGRIVWDEAFVIQVLLAQRRRLTSRLPAVPRPRSGEGLLAAFDRLLPYELTAGQRAVGEELFADLEGEHPMHRLLQGEVGSGKTVVALRAMLAVVDAGGQAALLAPTEVLAQQHARSLRDLLGPLATAGELGAPALATRVALLTGSLGAKRRREALEEAAAGIAGIVVGTHALLSEGVGFKDLGLVVVDEQHRFGVEQRDRLRGSGAGSTPHLLVMTATPIPRTVAMTSFGDLDVSELTELPRGRQPIVTHVVPSFRASYVDRMWEVVREEVAAGRQAFIVCPRITASEDDDGNAGAALEDVLPRLEQGPLAGLRLAPLHGRMAPEEKDLVMRAFLDREVEVLVATTVIEVGVDVPNSTVMVVLDADRFGISQLHQLRGRIGRGSEAGRCFLTTRMPEAARPYERLTAVAQNLDGMELARIDLEQRREGDVLGVAQSGRRSSLRHLNLSEHGDVIAEARVAALDLVESDPELMAHQALAIAVTRLVGEDHRDYLDKG